MKTLSSVAKCGIVILLAQSMWSITLADIVYDPETGTYIDDGAETTDDDSIFTPVDDSSVTTSSASSSTWSTTTGDTQTTLQPATTLEPVTPPANNNTNTDDVETTTENQIVQVNTASSSSDSELISSLQAYLQENADSLLWYLTERTAELESTYEDRISLKYGSLFTDLYECLWDTTVLQQIQWEIDTLANDLDTRIKASSADLYADIANLEYRLDLGLIGDDAQSAEGTVITTNIETLTQNFIILIDHYHSEASSSITNFVNSETSNEYQDILDTYVERRSLVDQIKQSFERFENSSFFSQTVVWPRADELRDLADDSFQVFADDMETRRGNRPAKKLNTFVSQAKSEYDLLVESTINDLFPFWDIQWLYDSYTLIWDIYDIGSDEYNCKELINNDYVDGVATKLLSKIESVQISIAEASSSVWAPKNWKQMQQGLSDSLLGYFDASVDGDFLSLRSNTKEMELTEDQKMFLRYKEEVVKFLGAMKIDFVSKGKNLRDFEAKLESAHTKASNRAKKAKWNIKTILQAIIEGIEEVLKG